MNPPRQLAIRIDRGRRDLLRGRLSSHVCNTNETSAERLRPVAAATSASRGGNSGGSENVETTETRMTARCGVTCAMQVQYDRSQRTAADDCGAIRNSAEHYRIRYLLRIAAEQCTHSCGHGLSATQRAVTGSPRVGSRSVSRSGRLGAWPEMTDGRAERHRGALHAATKIPGSRSRRAKSVLAALYRADRQNRNEFIRPAALYRRGDRADRRRCGSREGNALSSNAGGEDDGHAC
jgi:hypothetical protein